MTGKAATVQALRIAEKKAATNSKKFVLELSDGVDIEKVIAAAPWMCSKCGHNNSGDAKECRRCRTPHNRVRSGSIKVVSSRGQAEGGPPPKQARVPAVQQQQGEADDDDDDFLALAEREVGELSIAGGGEEEEEFDAYEPQALPAPTPAPAPAEDPMAAQKAKARAFVQAKIDDLLANPGRTPDQDAALARFQQHIKNL